MGISLTWTSNCLYHKDYQATRASKLRVLPNCNPIFASGYFSNIARISSCAICRFYPQGNLAFNVWSLNTKYCVKKITFFFFVHCWDIMKQKNSFMIFIDASKLSPILSTRLIFNQTASCFCIISCKLDWVLVTVSY